jgi:uncharacterized YccA/Bax inhibitor family protein
LALRLRRRRKRERGPYNVIEPVVANEYIPKAARFAGADTRGRRMSTTLMRTSNPTLNQSIFERAELESGHERSAMTVQGAAIKTLILVGIVAVTGAFIWSQLVTQEAVENGVRLVVSHSVAGYVFAGAIVGFIVALVTTFRPQWSPVTAPLYALCEGAVLGAVSALFETIYPGIVVQAVAATIGTLVVMMTIFATGLVPVTDRFRAGVIAATGAVCLVYVASMLLGFFGVHIPYIHESGLIGVGFSVVVVIIAALNLMLDFDQIATHARYGAPKFMEWYCAFSMLVTLVWLYLEILRLLAKLRNRN